MAKEDMLDPPTADLHDVTTSSWPIPWTPVHGSEDGFVPRLQAHALGVALAVAARLPWSFVRLGLGGLARVAKAVDRRHARAARTFLTQALGELAPAELEARVLQAYRHLFRIGIEPTRFRLRVPPGRFAEHYDVEWSADMERVRQSGDGCIFVTGHIGNWEAGAVAMPLLGFRPAYAVAKPPKNRPLSIRLQEGREALGTRVLPRRGAMAAAPKILREGGSLAMLLDQRARKRPVLAPFFGRLARCDRSAGVLMKRLERPVCLGACYLTERPLYYRVRFFDVLWPEELRQAKPEQIAERLNRGFERMILAAPDQYFWLHDRFKDTPEAVSDDR